MSVSLKEFLDEYGGSLAEKVGYYTSVIHDPFRDDHPDMDRFVNSMKRKPFPVQKEVIKGIVKAFMKGERAIYLIGEMGIGKSCLSIISALLLKKNPRVLIISPPHLVRKWIKEIEETVNRDCRVFNLNGKHCLSLLMKLKDNDKPLTPEFYIIGRERVKTHFRWRPAVITKKSLNYCPGCNHLLLNEEGMPLPVFARNNQGKYQRKYHCPKCSEQLWQPDISKPSDRKYMPAMYIKKKMKHFFDILIADEVHQMKNLSGQGYAFGILTGACKYVLCLTGTLAGGYASDLFYLIYRTHPQMMVQDGNPYRNPIHFMSKYGILEKVTVLPEEDGLTVRSKKKTVIRSKPGISPLLIGNMLLSNSVFVRLSDISENLPDYEEEVIEIRMDNEQAEAYRNFEQDIKTALTEAMDKGDYSLMGSYLNSLLSYPDRIYQGVEVYHPHTLKYVAGGPAVSGEMPKEKELIRIIDQELSEKRKMLVYIQNSNTTDISLRLAEMIEKKGYRVKTLKSGDTESRSEIIQKWVDEGSDVLICNPKLVETGMDLIAFPSIVFYQCGYSTYTLRQASRRSWRINQKQPVKVYYLTYSDTLQTKAMKLIATKLETSLALEGELTDKGLSALSESSDSMSKELARALLGRIDEKGSLKDLWSSYRKKELISDSSLMNRKSVLNCMHKTSIETEQIGSNTVKVSVTESSDMKRITRLAVEMICSDRHGYIQLPLF